MTTILKCHVTLWMGPLILSDHPAKFRVDRPYGTGNNDVCNISSNSNSISNSNSNAEVPMPRFTNGLFIVYNSVPFLEFLFFKIFSYNLWFFFDEFNMPHCKGLKTFLKIHCTHYLRIFFKHVPSQQ